MKEKKKRRKKITVNLLCEHPHVHLLELFSLAIHFFQKSCKDLQLFKTCKLLQSCEPTTQLWNTGIVSEWANERASEVLISSLTKIAARGVIPPWTAEKAGSTLITHTHNSSLSAMDTRTNNNCSVLDTRRTCHGPHPQKELRNMDMDDCMDIKSTRSHNWRHRTHTQT